jgi:hypothetical protein
MVRGPVSWLRQFLLPPQRVGQASGAFWLCGADKYRKSAAIIRESLIKIARGHFMQL